MQVINKCQVNFTYKVSDKGVSINKTVFSNCVITELLDEKLKIFHYIDKKKTYRFDILTCTTIIENRSKFDMKCLFLQNIVSGKVKYIANSLKIDGIKKICADFKEGIFIKSLNAKSDIKVQFKMLVEGNHSEGDLKSFSLVQYKHIYNIERPPCTIIKKSNVESVEFSNKLFKQMSIINNIKINERIDNIININSYIDIIDKKHIRSYQRNLLSILIICKIQYDITYKSRGRSYNIREAFGFSFLLTVPIGINISDCDEDIHLEIEKSTYNILNQNNIIIDNNLLVYY